MKTKRTINEILDLHTGQILQAADYLNKPLDELTIIRSELDRANQGFRDKFIVCSVCGEKLRMLGGRSRSVLKKSRNFHFAHLHNSKECPIKTTSKYSKEDINRMKYRGATESLLHQELKAMIAHGLHLNQTEKGQVSDIQIEKVVRSLDEEEWKKPDIILRFNETRIAVELQLSTTWLDVITKRQEFYRSQEIYVLWIFHVFERTDDLRKLTYSDIIYTNNNNAYVFDPVLAEKSFELKDLVLTCHYLEYYADESKVCSEWKNVDVTLDMLTYRPATGQLFFFDSLASKELATRQAEQFKEKELEREREEEREQWKRIAEKRELSERLQNSLKQRKFLVNKITEEKRQIDFLVEKIHVLTERIPHLEEETRNLYFKLEHSCFYGLPPLVVELGKVFQQEFHVIIAKIVSLNEARKAILVKDKNIRQLQVKTVAEKTYQILDKIRDWQFISENYKSLFCFRIDQPDDLWNTPKVQGIVPHQLAQLKFNSKVHILADFSERLNDYKEALARTDADLLTEQQRLALFQHRFCTEIHHQYITCVKQEIQQLHEERENGKSSRKATEQQLLKLNDEIKVIRKDLEQYYYVEDEI